MPATEGGNQKPEAKPEVVPTQPPEPNGEDWKAKYEVEHQATWFATLPGITPTQQVDDAVREYTGFLFGLHNHPSNIPPTGSDFATSGYRGYAGAVVVLHNGEVYYCRHGPHAFSSREFDVAVEKEKRRGYDEINAFERVLDDYERRFGIEWRRL